MTIHSRSRNDVKGPEPSCAYHQVLFAGPLYESVLTLRHLDFYNYFQHGIDFLISEHTHLVKKIVLHSNVVCLLFLFIYLICACYFTERIRTLLVARYAPISAISEMSLAN